MGRYKFNRWIWPGPRRRLLADPGDVDGLLRRGHSLFIVDWRHLPDIQLIGLLRNAALNSLKYKQELALVREQNIDITHFEEDLDAFKLAFAKNYNSASTNFGKAIDEIDKAIKRMEEVKKFLTTSENQLRLANNKLEDVSVKKLTQKNPTMKAKFEALKGE